nr:TetR/AcrR family transcriptional regulator [Patulibacter sp. SYSU D01012]
MLAEALRLLADGGVPAVTHRAIERAAGVPHGSVTYHLGGRAELLGAMIERVCAISEAQVTAIAHDLALALAPRDREIPYEAVADRLIAWMDDERGGHLARLELELAGARDPDVRVRMTAAARPFWRLCEPLVVALGSAVPERDARALASWVDGLLLDRLAHDPPDRDVVVAALRHALSPWAGEPSPA